MGRAHAPGGQQLGKRRAGGGGLHAAPPAANAAAEGGNAPVPKRSKVEPPSPAPGAPATLQDFYSRVLDAPSPLGLRLRKSPSLLDLIQTRLAHVKSATRQSAMENSISHPPKKKEIKAGTPISGERFKASNFPANVLEIGSWKYTARYEGDLVAKCYFAKHKLVWEVLDDGLKRKIEIQWSDITALKADCADDENGTLELALARPPLFYKESDPQPRKHTLWQPASDFTGGQASLHRRHVLQGPSNLLIKNFEKIIQCDQRLNQLSQLPDIILDSPIFEPRYSVFENPNELKKCHGYKNLKNQHEAPRHFTNSLSPHVASMVSKSYEVKNIIVNQPVPMMSKRHGVKDLILNQPELLVQPMNYGLTDVQADGVAQGLKNPNWLNTPQVPARLTANDLTNHIGNGITEERIVDDPQLLNEMPSEELSHEFDQSFLSESDTIDDSSLLNEMTSEELLQEFDRSLLSESDAYFPLASDKEYLMARVRSLSSLLEEDAALVTMPMPEPNGGGGWIKIDEVDFDFDVELSSPADTETAGSTEPPADTETANSTEAPADTETANSTEPPAAILRNDSFEDLLLKLPHIASISQLDN